MIKAARVTEILAGVRGKHVAIVGDLMLDRYVWGNVRRISAEAPVPIVEATRTTERLGGSANVAANVLGLGAVAVPVGLVGDDIEGRALRELLISTGADVEAIVTDRSRPTTRKTRVISQNQQMIRLDVEDDSPLADDLAAELRARAAMATEASDAVIISDYGKGVVSRALIEAVLERARHRGIPVCVDPKEDHVDRYVGVTVITPNLAEAGAAVGRRLKTDEDVAQAGAELLARLSAESVLITRGEHGMSLFRPGSTLHVPTVATEVYDVTGAGDTVVSVFCLAHAAGGSLEEATEIANHAASLVIRDVGTVRVAPETLVASFGERP